MNKLSEIKNKKIKIIRKGPFKKNTPNISSNLKFSKLSQALTQEITSTDKKKHGIYFTPPPIIVQTLKFIKTMNIPIQSILEPSCGSGEFLDYLDMMFPNTNITGIEYHPKIYQEIKKKIFTKTKVDIIEADFLKYNSSESYDLIVGNPPYYVVPKKDISPDYLSYFTGRPNIYLFFIIKSLSMLKLNGILALVLPNNFLNCLYYDKLRQHIYQNYTICHIEDHSQKKYLDTQQDTCVIIIQNKKPANTIP